jgi:hypothetical protein
MGTDILLTTPSGIVRIVLRIYFTVLLLLVSLMGSKICAVRARLQLARHGSIPVARLSGWHDWSKAVLFNWSLRSNALGSLGFVMLFAGLLSKGSDLAVSGLVNKVMIETRCPFNVSMPNYLVLAREYYSQSGSAPDPMGSFFNLATQAQINSVRNGGLDAVYAKFNDDVDFRATYRDVAANWTCNELVAVSAAVYDPSLTP